MLTHDTILLLAHWAVAACALMLTGYFLEGFKVGNFFSAFLIAMVLAFLNTFIRPILFFLTLPLNILTLGLFTFVVNAIVLRLCAALLPNFSIKSWWTAIGAAVILTIVGGLLHLLII